MTDVRALREARMQAKAHVKAFEDKPLSARILIDLLSEVEKADDAYIAAVEARATYMVEGRFRQDWKDYLSAMRSLT